MKKIIIGFISLLSVQAIASNTEREELANYLRELKKLDRILVTAKQSTPQGSAIRFKYSAFDSDLKKLKEELQVYLDLPNRNPRTTAKEIKSEQ